MTSVSVNCNIFLFFCFFSVIKKRNFVRKKIFKKKIMENLLDRISFIGWAIVVESRKIVNTIISHPQINEPTKSCLLPFISQFFKFNLIVSVSVFFFFSSVVDNVLNQMSWCDRFCVMFSMMMNFSFSRWMFDLNCNTLLLV